MRDILATMTIAVATVFLSPAPLVAADDQENSDADRTVTVEATDFDFSPKKIEIDSSTTLKIVLVNKGNVTHSWAIPELDKKSDRIQPGKQTAITLSPGEPGTYKIACQVPGHEQIGMVGELVVTSDD